MEGTALTLTPTAAIRSIVPLPDGGLFIRTSGNDGEWLYTLSPGGELLEWERADEHADGFYPDEPYGYLTGEEAVLPGADGPCRIPLEGLEMPRVIAPGWLCWYEDAFQTALLLCDPAQPDTPLRVDPARYGYAGWQPHRLEGVGEHWLVQLMGENYATHTILIDRAVPSAPEAVLWEGEGWWKAAMGGGRIWMGPDIEGLSGTNIGHGLPFGTLDEAGQLLDSGYTADRFVLSPDGTRALLVTWEGDATRFTVLDLTAAEAPEALCTLTLRWTFEDPLDPIALTDGGRIYFTAERGRVECWTPVQSAPTLGELRASVERDGGDAVLDPLIFGMGLASWSDVSAIDPDRWIGYYLRWLTNDRLRGTLPAEDRRNGVFGGAAIAGEDLEAAVGSRFAVDRATLRQASGYDPGAESYAIVPLALADQRYTLDGITEQADALRLDYTLRTASGGEAAGQVVIEPAAGGFHYRSHTLRWTAGGPDRYADAYRMILPFAYDLGRTSWRTAAAIDPDALVVYYLSLQELGEVSFPLDGPREPDFGNLWIPADALEAAITRHLAVDIEALHTARYYDPAGGRYWTGGIGTLAELAVTGATDRGNVRTITFTRTLPQTPPQSCTLTLDILADGGYRYRAYAVER